MKFLSYLFLRFWTVGGEKYCQIAYLLHYWYMKWYYTIRTYTFAFGLLMMLFDTCNKWLPGRWSGGGTVCGWTSFLLYTCIVKIPEENDKISPMWQSTSRTRGGKPRIISLARVLEVLLLLLLSPSFGLSKTKNQIKREKKPLMVSGGERERVETVEPWGAEPCGGQLSSWGKRRKKQSIVWGTNGFCSPPRDFLLLPTSPSLFFRAVLCLVKLWSLQ